jgi:hypothetical protein
MNASEEAAITTGLVSFENILIISLKLFSTCTIRHPGDASY